MRGTDCDVLVAGAGPAGSIAARELARRGYRVLLVDRDTVDKPGEALPGATGRLLRALGLPLPAESGAHAPIGGNLSAWGAGTLVARDFFGDPDGPGWRLDRLAFERELRGHAQSAGASCRTALVREVRAAGDGDGHDVVLSDGSRVRASWLVDASGRAAHVARRCGARRRRGQRLVAVWGTGVPAQPVRLTRTVVEAVPDGWWYGAVLPDGFCRFMLHTDPRNAAQLVAEPRRWRQALACTRHVAALLPAAVDTAPRGVDASAARLDRLHGPGWLACGDAALSFDPIASQGIFSALHGGMAAARTVDGALAGDRDAPNEYAAQLDRVWQIYLRRAARAYADEQRWPDRPFWSARHQRVPDAV